MFIQVVRGEADDASGLFNRWEEAAMPGLLRATSGVAHDGTLVALMHFESSDAAERNRAWWRDALPTGTLFDCPIVDDVEIRRGSDDPGFVQITTCRISDVKAARELGARFAAVAPVVRPDLIGFVDAYTADGRCFTTSYFTSESEAREGESRERPPEHQEIFDGLRSLVSDFKYFDLGEPRLFTPA